MELLTYLLKSAAILFLFYAVYRFALKSDTFFVANRLYLLSGTLAAICLPALTFTTVTYIEAPVIEAGTALNLVPQLQQTLQPGPVSVPWWQPVLFVYFAGVTVFLLRFFVQLFSLLRLLQKNTAEKMGRYRYIKVKGTLSPFSFFNHIVYNPAQHTPEELEMIVSHEKVHARQWHSVDLLLVNLLRALQWPSPIAWLYKKSTVENLEFIADSKTIQHVASPTKYQLALVKASSTCNAPALTNSFYNPFARLSVLGSKITVPGHIGHIKKRIIMLNKTNSHRNNRLKLLAILPLLAVFMWGFQVEEKTGHIEPATEKTITGTLQTNGPGPTAEGTLPQKAQQPAPGENTQVKPRATAKARTKTVPATKHTGNGNTPPVLFKVAPTFAGAKK
ncbi:MAG: M56 family metallopeptidase, partial [Marinirhabdus sp.]